MRIFKNMGFASLPIFCFSLMVAFGNRVENTPNVSSGEIFRIESFDSKYVDSRTIDIWLPKGYSSNEKYSVLYMHDGQMLFDRTKTWNKQEWMVDEVLSELMINEKVRNTIVVGIWNNESYRHSEYFPQKVLNRLTPEIRQEISSKSLNNRPQADNYLKFIVEELKPYIDSAFFTYPSLENTFIAGSSMGGVISIYALCEYPQIFIGAACISTHWPLVLKGKREVSDIIANEFREYLKEHLPKSGEHLVYFDYGTETLDSLYKPHQIVVDEIMHDKGYNNKNWITLEFEGEEHSEKSWSKRLSEPFTFLLKK